MKVINDVSLVREVELMNEMVSDDIPKSQRNAVNPQQRSTPTVEEVD